MTKSYRVRMTDAYVWYDETNQLHREDGPACEGDDGSVYYVVNGVRHREDGPAVIKANGHKEWWLNGVELGSVEHFIEVQALHLSRMDNQ